jgi:hypothetical protein
MKELNEGGLPPGMIRPHTILGEHRTEKIRAQILAHNCRAMSHPTIMLRVVGNLSELTLALKAP